MFFLLEGCLLILRIIFTLLIIGNESVTRFISVSLVSFTKKHYMWDAFEPDKYIFVFTGLISLYSGFSLYPIKPEIFNSVHNHRGMNWFHYSRKKQSVHESTRRGTKSVFFL